MVIQLNQPEVPQRLHGVTLVDRHGLPRFWANVWALMALADHAELTRLRKLHHVERLYAYADGMLGAGALDDALADLDDARLGTILEGWFVSLRNQARPTASDQERWRAGLEFVVAVSTWLGQGMARDDRLAQLDARWQRLHLLYGQLQIQRHHRVNVLRSLPAAVVQALYERLDPSAPTNPFKGMGTRWRVFIAFVLMLHQGLRRGELLLLSADAIKSGFDARQQRTRYWLNVGEHRHGAADPRHSRPGIKTPEFRRWQRRLPRQASAVTAATLAEKELRIAELERQVRLLTSSHLAMIRVVGELGGFSKWAAFYEHYAEARAQLEALGALPVATITPLHSDSWPEEDEPPKA